MGGFIDGDLAADRRRQAGEVEVVREQLNGLQLQAGKDSSAIWRGEQNAQKDSNVPLKTLAQSFKAAQELKTALKVLGLVYNPETVTVDLEKPGWTVTTPFKQINRLKLDTLNPPPSWGGRG